MNRPIRGVAVTAMVMFFALMANLSYLYVGQQNYLNERPENRRVADARFGQDRGPIMVGNTPVAESEAVKDRYKFQRSYSSGKLYAPVTGFYSYLYRTSALESSYSAQLAGVDDSQFLNRLVNTLSGSSQRGGTVETTLDAKAQKAAWDALDGRKGAVVAIDYTTGAIKALVTSPSYDPNDLSTHDLAASTKAWNRLNADTSRPMSNRATKEIYSPGSTFKLVTAAAALDSGMDADTKVDASAYKLPGSTKVISGNCGGTRITLAQALKVSCNPAFARLGAELGADAIREQAEKFGFGTAFLSDIGSSASVFPDDIDAAQTAMSAIGEYETKASPLQMAMVSAAIANDGVVMDPYIVDQVLDNDLKVVSQTRPQQQSVALSAENAAELRSMMVQVVQSGTGYRAQIAGVKVGGKTGTARTSADRNPYAWFTAWADDPSIAVCAFVEDADIPATEIAGGAVAAPIAKAVIEALR
ncbi:peptidoglycan D,D-transpeptidase FtsI family protein [Propionicimonas sp.]|uniref:peptidoglycan D,D-transpeptidase FtsI family protein n=1 Tax=Propionicimonas sp. TaxID=1955623 RepID=UPI0039E508C2